MLKLGPVGGTSLCEGSIGRVEVSFKFIQVSRLTSNGECRVWSED